MNEAVLRARNDYEKGGDLNSNPYPAGSSAHKSYASEMQRQFNIEQREMKIAAGEYA